MLDASLAELVRIAGLLALAAWIKIDLSGHHILIVLKHLALLAQWLVESAGVCLTRLLLVVLSDNYHRLTRASSPHSVLILG